MANTYIRLNLAAPGGGTDDKTVKVSSNDSLSGFLEGKIITGSSKVVTQTLNDGGDEEFEIDVDETQIDHNNLTNYEVGQHRIIDDASTTTTSLWSSNKIQTELDSKINSATPMTDNKLVKSVGTSGVDVEATGIDVDDSNNVTGINDIIIDGDLTVNGTTTSVNTDNLDVEDANITVNVGGTQASANSADAGITVEMSDATDALIGYDSTLPSRFKLGEVGALQEVVTVGHSQTITNKTIDVDNNTVSNIETDNLKSGVLETDLNNAVDDTKLASAEAIKEYVAQELGNQDDASEITYTPDDLSDWDGGVDPGNVDGALDQLAERTTTAEGTLSSHIGAGAGKHSASQITNTPSGGISATDIQGVVNELDSEKYDSANFNGDFDSRLGTSSVTDLSDITDAGSGAIITGIERTTLGTALQSGDASTTLDHTQADPADWTVADGSSVGAHLDEIGSRLVTQESKPNPNVSSGDILESSFSLSQSASGASVTGLSFANGVVRAFEAIVSVEIDATADLYEEYTLKGIQKGSDWDITVQSLGDDTLIDFDINSSGQVIYDSSTYAGFVSGSIRFRADTVSV